MQSNQLLEQRTITEINHTSNFGSLSISFSFRAKCRAFLEWDYGILWYSTFFPKFLNFLKNSLLPLIAASSRIWDITVWRYFLIWETALKCFRSTWAVLCSFYSGMFTHMHNSSAKRLFFIGVVKESSVCSNKDVLFGCFTITISTVYGLLEDFSLQKSCNNY